MPEATKHRHVLLVAYLFPPAGGVGVHRALSYVRYLPACGCRVTVLTPRNPASPVSDPGLSRLVPASTSIVRTFTPEIPYAWRDSLYKRFAGVTPSSASAAAPPPAGGLKSRLRDALHRLVFPDPQVVWTPFALRAARALYRSDPFDTVLVTAPPFSSLSIGLALKRSFPSLRLISEFRDEWVDFYLTGLDPTATAWKRAAAVQQERLIAESSDYLVAVTEAQAQCLRSRHPHLPASRFLAVHNGYDPEVFSSFRSRPHNTGRIVVTFFGSVYANRVHSPQPLFDALARLPEPLRERFEFRFIGRVAQEAGHFFDRPGLPLRRYGFLPHAEALSILEETDFLLLIVNDSTGHAGKAFEYLATGKPILALTPPSGSLGALLAECRAGRCADPARPEEIDALLEWASTPAAIALTPDRDKTRQFSRAHTVAHFAAATGLSA